MFRGLFEEEVASQTGRSAINITLGIKEYSLSRRPHEQTPKKSDICDKISPHSFSGRDCIFSQWSAK